MIAQPVSLASLICLGRAQRAAVMRAPTPQTPAGNVTEFRGGMLAAASEQALTRGRMLLLPARELEVTCLDGELWLTRDGDSEDYILGPGQRLAIGSSDQAAIQALRDSRLRLVER